MDDDLRACANWPLTNTSEKQVCPFPRRSSLPITPGFQQVAEHAESASAGGPVALVLQLPSDQATMDDVLSIAEIEAKFDSGTVRCQGKDRDEVYRRAVVILPKRFAILYAGTMPEGTEIAL